MKHTKEKNQPAEQTTNLPMSHYRRYTWRRTGDTGKLASNPIIERLLDNPGVLEIYNKVK